MTTTERGIPRYEHSHLVAALDVLLEYQRNRKTTYFKVMGTRAQTSLAPYRHDPRTRLIELLKGGGCAAMQPMPISVRKTFGACVLYVEIC